MKNFRNTSGAMRMLPALGVAVADGDTFEVTDDQAEGLLLQCAAEDAWLEPVDDDTRAAVQSATSTSPGQVPDAASGAAVSGHAASTSGQVPDAASGAAVSGHAAAAQTGAVGAGENTEAN